MRVAASLLAVGLVACGDGGSGANDDVDAAGGLDGASTDGGPSGTVTVHVAELGTPVAGVRVYFQRADASLVAAVDTDAAGMASADVPAGAWVSVLAPYLAGGQPWIETIGGVEPGDVLRFDAPVRRAVDLTVSIPKDPGAASYEVHANCDDEDASSVIVPDADTAAFDVTHGSCPATIDFLVISRDATGARLKWLYAPGQTPVASAVTITGTYTAAMRTLALTYTNVPDDAERLTVRYQLAAPDEARVTFGDIVVIESPSSTETTTLVVPDGIEASPGVPLRASVRATARRPGNNHRVVDGLAPTATTHTADFVALSGFASEAQYDRDAGTITWTAADASPRDLAFAFLTQSRTMGGQPTSWYRTVLVPHTGPELTIPDLPVEDFDYNLTAADSGAVLELAMATVPGGYAAIRGRFFTTFNPFIAPSLVGPGERALLVEATPR